MTGGPAQDYPQDQHLTDKKIKVKGGLLSKDLGQTEVIIEKVEETIVKVIELSNRGKAGVEYPSKQPHGTTLTKMIAGRKEELNQSIGKPEHTTGSLALQANLLWYGYLTNSNLLTTPNTMAKLNPSNGLESTPSQSN
jgi:hypothetical protein